MDHTNKLLTLNAQKGLTSNMLKLCAVIGMVLEHFSIFVPNDNSLWYIMRFCGKLSAPIFFYLVVESYHHTHNKNKYTRNMAIFALISYLPFILCFDGVLNLETFLNFNVIYTLLIGLLVLRARHEIRNPIIKYLIIGLLFILSCFGDWSYFAPLMILTFNIFYGDNKKQAYAYAVVALIKPKMQSNLLITILSPILSLSNPHMRYLDFTSWDTFFLLELGTLFPAILLYLYNGQKGKSSPLAKWSFYIVYPLHLLIIAVLKWSIQ